MTLIKSPVQLLRILCFALLSQLALGQPAPDNSNLWPVYRDTQVGFHISYPTGWIIVPTKGPNVRFSVNPPIGAGNCNVVARPNAELNGMTQAALNREIESMPADQASWADYIGIPLSQVHVMGFRRATILDVPALMGIVETELENLAGKTARPVGRHRLIGLTSFRE